MLLPVSFAFNVLVVQSRWFWPLVILGNLSVWHGLPMIGVPFLTGAVVASGRDSPSVRRARAASGLE